MVTGAGGSIGAELCRKYREKQAVIHETIDESLIGGMVLRVGDLRIDNSIRRKLEVLRKNLMAKEKLF